MKKFIDKTESVTRRLIKEIECDLCHRVKEGGSWKKEYGDVSESTVKLETGWTSRDCGEVEETTIDICPDCFVAKLIPWVESHGGQATVTRIEL